MNSQTIAAVVATITGLAVAAYAFSYVSFGDTYKSESQVVKTETKAPVAEAIPVVRGPVVRDLPLSEK
jgi:hypothetical protein